MFYFFQKFHVTCINFLDSVFYDLMQFYYKKKLLIKRTKS